MARDLDRRIDASGAQIPRSYFTSGTTGRSKGVVLSGERSISAARHTVAFDRLTDRDEVLAYLPLAWVGDHYLNYAQGYVAGFCITPEGAETVANDLREIGPTYHFAPPRVFEALLTGADPHGGRERSQALAVSRFHDCGRTRKGERIANGEPKPIGARLAYRLGDLLIYARSRTRSDRAFASRPQRAKRSAPITSPSTVPLASIWRSSSTTRRRLSCS